MAITLSQFGCRSAAPIPFRPDLEALWRAGRIEEILRIVEKELQSNTGQPFPNLPLRDAAGSTSTLDQFKGKRLAVLLAGGSCQYTLEWTGRLAANGWNVPNHTLIILITSFDDRVLVRSLRHAPYVFQFDWPLPSFLEPVRSYPVVFFVDAEGVFTGFKAGSDPPFQMPEDIKGGPL